jgi:hypothetical protein
MKPEDVLQSRPMTTFAFTTASATPRAALIPVEAEFFVEDCGLYRKLRFKCDIAGPGVEIQIGGQTKSVHTLDVTQTRRCIIEVIKTPFSPLAWWESIWRRAGPVPVVADRLMKILGKPYIAIIEAEPGTIVATRLEDIQIAADQYLAGVDFLGWTEDEKVFEFLIPGDGQNYPAKIRCKKTSPSP